MTSHFIYLSEDAFFHICEWLSVQSILCLRLVNSTICELTRHSSIWLSLLRRLTLALPPGQPILPDELGYYPFRTLEFFVSRTLKLEQNWKEYNPLASHYRFNGHQRILLMRFLPGGRHMVSVSKSSSSGNSSIVVWDMTYRGRRNHVAIAMLNSETPVHKLHVRYAIVSGQACLLAAFSRPPVDGRTVIAVTYITVEILEELSRLGPGSQAFAEQIKLIPNPFNKILEPRTRYPVGALSLGEVRDHPVLAAVHRPRTVVFYFLESGKRASLKLAPLPRYEHWRSSIWDIKILSSQDQILVIRVLITELNGLNATPLIFEIYDIPLEDTEKEDPVPSGRKIIQDYNIEGFYVSDSEASWWFKHHPDPHIPMLHKLADCPPPPISIFVTTKAPRGFVHYLMIPEIPHGSPDSSSDRCIYRLPIGTHGRLEWDEAERAVIIPGAYRSIVWMRSPGRQPLQGVEVVRLAVYRTEGYSFSGPLDTGHISSISGTAPSQELPTDLDRESMDIDEHFQDILDHQPAEDPRNRAMKYPVVPEEVAQAMRAGTHSIQFDEWLGRLCVATTQDDWIQVLDWSI